MAYRLLVVDDDRDIVESLRSLLLKENYEVVVSYTGEEALSKVKESDPDIILLDLILPGINGYEVLKEIRENHKDKWRPVIIISAKTELESLERCYKLEADHYLTKPCDFQNILQGIQTMISLIPARIQ